MKTEYLPTFVKDLKTLKSTPIYTTIRNFAFQDVLACQNIGDLSNIKKLKGQDNAYRVRIGDYRIGFFVTNDIITFARVLHRREFYRHFP